MKQQPNAPKLNSGKSVTIALVQLACHPSFRIGGAYMSHEPFLDHEFPGPLQSLWENGLPVESLQAYCRDRYLIWHRARLSAIVDWIKSLQPGEFPDIILFPEGSIPRKFLSCLHKKLRKANGYRPTIFAGSHAFEPTPEAWNDYRRLGVSCESFTELCRLRLDSVSVCPILHQDGSITLQPKTLLSPWEVTAIGLPEDPDPCAPPEPVTHKLNESESIQVSALVCSEALQQLQGHHSPPDLVAVLSYNHDHRRFGSIEDHYAKNQIPVAYCNDGRYGGSHINVVNDDRNENWLNNDPRNGSLPPGDGIVVWQTTIQRVAPSKGINNPLPTSRLLRLASIVPEDESDGGYRVSLALDRSRATVEGEIAKKVPVNVDGLHTTLEQILECEQPTPIQAIQLKRLVGLCRNSAAPLQEWKVFASDCIVGRADVAKSQEILTNPKFAVVSSGLRTDTEQGAPPLPSTIKKLEFALAEYCLAGLGTLLEKASGTATQTLLAARQRLLRHVGLIASPSPPVTLSELLSQIRNESRESATVQLSNELARIVEKFGATSGMLFIVHPAVTTHSKQFLVSQIMVNTPIQRIEREVSSEAGIVGHVAFTKRPYLSDRVVTDTLEADPLLDPFYRLSVPTTMSEMAVPIIGRAVDGKTSELIGVLNLESRRPGAFSPLQLQALQVEATRLLVDVRVMQTCNDPHAAVVWHPRVHGWSLQSILDRICYRVATAQSRGSRPPTISCTIWCHDEVKHALFVRGTSRYDFEYISHEILDSNDSFLGDQLRELRDGQVKQGQVSDLPRFRRRRKAEQMELAGVSVCPFSIRRTIGKPTKGILAIYSFAHESKAVTEADFASFPPATVSRLASIISEVISQLHHQRTLCGLAYFESEVSQGSALSGDRFDRVREALGEILQADQSSLFELRDGKAQLVSTSGVNKPSGTYSQAPKQRTAARKGFTATLLQASGLTLRKHDIPNPHELCKIADEVVTIVPQNSVKEIGAVTETEHRRFLGASIGINDVVQGIARLIRPEQDRPFVQADEDLLQILANPVAELFAENATLSAAVRGSKSPCDAPAFGFGPWSERQLDAWLQQYRTLCGELSSKSDPALSSLRFATQDIRGEWGLRILAYHSSLSRTCHRNEDDASIRRPNIGWITIDSTLSHQIKNPRPRIVTFDRKKTSLYDCGMEHGIDVQSGVCVPVYWVGNAQLVPGVVAVDFVGQPNWTDDGIGHAFLKTLELSGMARGVAVSDANTENSIGDWVAKLHETFQDVCLLWRPTDESDFDVGQQLVATNSQFTQVEFLAMQKHEWKYSSWEPRVSWLHHLDTMGVKFVPSNGLMWIPLRLGPFHVFGLLVRAGKQWLTDSKKRASEKISRLDYRKCGLKSFNQLRERTERLTGLGLENQFLLREVQTVVEVATDSWSSMMLPGKPLWDEVDVGMAISKCQIARNVDSKGLRMWMPTISRKRILTRHRSERSRRK